MRLRPYSETENCAIKLPKLSSMIIISKVNEVFMHERITYK